MAATQLSVFQMALRFLADARLATITDDVESQYALTDAWASAPSFVLRQAAWRFALKTATMSVGGAPIPGYAGSYAFPADWLRTHAIFLSLTDGRECPFDFREQGTSIYVNIGTAPAMRYVSNVYIDPAFAPWPEQFAECVAAYLAFLVAERVTGDRNAAGKMSQLFSSLMPQAQQLDAITEDRWLPFQRNGSFLRGALHVLDLGYWRFAMQDAAISAPSGTPPGGFAFSFAKPANWLKNHKLFIASGGRECPLDIRDGAGFWATNIPAFQARYVSSAVGTDATQWPQPFHTAVLAYLEFQSSDEYERQAGYRGDPKAAPSKSAIFEEALGIALDRYADPEWPWLKAELDGSFQRVARTMIDQGFWRFARVTVSVATTVGGAGGFARQATIPADSSRTRSLYVLTTDKAPTGAGERRPFKVREHGGLWYTDATQFYAEYISVALAMDSTKWPDHYMRAVLRAVHFDQSTRSDDKDQKDDLAIYKDALADTADSEADAPDPWLAYQLDGSFDGGSRAVLARGYWWWATKTLNIDVSSQEVAQAQSGLPYRFALPADWMRTRGLYVAYDGRQCPINIRESNEDWSTDAPAWTAEYLSTDVLDPTTWPEAVAAAILAYLDLRDDQGPPAEKERGKEQIEAAEYQKLLADALDIYSLDENPWLRFQLDGRYIIGVNQLLEHGRWRFAVKTRTLTDPNNPSAISLDPNANPPTVPLPGDPVDDGDDSSGAVSPGYACRIVKPNDWLRTLRVYYSYSDGIRPLWLNFDYRDELGAIHCNYNPIQMRYVSRLGLDSTRWPSHFREAVQAWLEYSEARADPKLTKVAAEKLALFEKAGAEAETLDDTRDVQRINTAGRFVRGRYGRGGGMQRAQDFWPM